jgi:hypothetical protein
MYRSVVRRRMEIRRGAKGVVETVRIMVIGMRSVLSEICVKNDYVECMAEIKEVRRWYNESSSY